MVLHHHLITDERNSKHRDEWLKSEFIRANLSFFPPQYATDCSYFRRRKTVIPIRYTILQNNTKLSLFFLSVLLMRLIFQPPNHFTHSSKTFENDFSLFLLANCLNCLKWIKINCRWFLFNFPADSLNSVFNEHYFTIQTMLLSRSFSGKPFRNRWIFCRFD